MSESTTGLGGFFGALPRDYKTAQPKKSMPQEEKVRFIAGLTLTRLFRDGGVTVEQLEQDAAGRATGRLSLTLGAGVGGKGGMRRPSRAGRRRFVLPGQCAEPARTSGT